MICVRRLLGSFVAAWLTCQTAALGLTPNLVVWFGVTDVSLMVCTCGHGADATCPMHHHGTANGSRRCVMRSMNDHGTAVLASVFGLLGFLTAHAQDTMLTSSERAISIEPSIGIDRPTPPDPPPPRV
jgi:hypothetical protein